MYGRLMIIYSMSVSADGYVNGPDGTFDWTAPTDELHRFHNQRMTEIDAQLLGRRLYEAMLVWETQEFDDPTMVEFAESWRPLERIVFSTTLEPSRAAGGWPRAASRRRSPHSARGRSPSAARAWPRRACAWA